MIPTIAIVGRPNVGKSSLFNRLIGRRIAIVHDQPGVTRDRVESITEWLGKKVRIVDTGGLGSPKNEKLPKQLLDEVRNQVLSAIQQADLIFFVVNREDGIVPLDQEVADLLRRSGRKVWLLVNKVDNTRMELDLAEFDRLGFERTYPVSAIHGHGAGDLFEDAIHELFKDEPPGQERQKDDGEDASDEAGPEETTPKIAIVGRPNVGKSSLVNQLSRSKRVIVSEIPGTTRDAVDVPFTVEKDGVQKSYCLIDTAGLRATNKMDSSIEFYSSTRAEQSIKRCDLAVLVVDASAGPTAFEKKIAGKIADAGKPCIIVINKWDVVETRKNDRRIQLTGLELLSKKDFGYAILDELFFLDYAPIIFVSAHTGYGVGSLLDAFEIVLEQKSFKFPTGPLNRVLNAAVEQSPPVSASGKRLKIFYTTQLSQEPPTLVMFVNDPALCTDRYLKYLSSSLREEFQIENVPILWKIRRKTSTSPDDKKPVAKGTTVKRQKSQK